LYYTVSGIITPMCGRPVHNLCSFNELTNAKNLALHSSHFAAN